MASGRIYVIRTFLRSGDGNLAALPPTICFERELALEMAYADKAESSGVAVYEIDTAARAETETRPFIAFGAIPENYRCVARTALLAAAPAIAEPARLQTS
jgi:hypothetical protein